MKRNGVRGGLSTIAVSTVLLGVLAFDAPTADLGDVRSSHATTFEHEVIAPGPVERIGRTDAALGQPVTAPLGGLQAVSVGGAVAWAEPATQDGVVPGTPEIDDAFGAAAVVADFDGDGIGDVAIGAPGEAVGALAEAGTLIVVPGGVRSFQLNQAIGESQAGAIPGIAEQGDRFGAALAAGDFDNDGNPDLAIGAPGEDVGAIADAGAVSIVPGTGFSPNAGLDVGTSATISQSTGAIPGGAEVGDAFGSALAVGDFDNDGHDDLAIGSPGESVGATATAGGIVVLYGSPSGLQTNSSARFFGQDSPGIVGTAEADDRFGSALATGDLNDDGFDDLVVGIPGEDIGTVVDAGAVAVIFGSAGGLNSSANAAYSANSSGLAGSAETDDRFGAAVAVADIDGDDLDDVVVGIPGEDIGSIDGAGAIHVLPSAGTSIDTSADVFVSQDTAGVAGAAEAGDAFGTTVAAADVVGSDRPDVVVGIPGEDLGSTVDAGALAVFAGSNSGVTIAGHRSIHADTSGVPGAAEANDRFGDALATGDLNGDLTVDLVVGVPGEAIGAISGAGGIVSMDPRPPAIEFSTDQADEQSGDQLHVIYAIPSDNSPSRAMDAAIRTDIATADGFFFTQLGNRNLRWDTSNGALDLSVVYLTQTEAQIASGNDLLNLENAIAAQGFNASDKAYIVYYEGQGSSSNTCGVTFEFDIAALWLDACGGVYPEYTAFPFGATYLLVHEMTHLLGAVSFDAPNHCCVGHLDDDNRDVLYQAPSGPTIRDWNNLMLDPGNDDYYQHSGPWPDLDDSDYL